MNGKTNSKNTLTNDLKAQLYTKMQLIRRFEESCLELFDQGLLNGTVHTCIGQEACAVGVIENLNKETDVVFSNHRGHGHYIAYHNNIDSLLSEIMGKESGICEGFGGTQHICDKNYYSNGIQGGIAPVTVGIALADKLKKTNSVSVVFLGDGTLGEGVVYESMNIASKQNLPVLFVLENNQYAQTTPIALSHAGNIYDRAKPFGIKSEVVIVNNIDSVYSTSRMLINKMREKPSPAFLCLETYRLSAHSKGDDLRDKSEINFYKEKDPLTKLKSELTREVTDGVDEEIEKRIKLAISSAIESPVKNYNVHIQEMKKLYT